MAASIWQRCLIAFCSLQGFLVSAQGSCSGDVLIVDDRTFESTSGPEAINGISDGSCKKWTGNIEFSSNSSGASPNKPTWNNLQTLDGTLRIHDCKLTEFLFPELESITGDFILSNLPGYSNAYSMPKLKSIGGAIDWRDLPKFRVSITLVSLETVESIAIINSAITDLDGGALQTTGAINITENKSMKTVKLPVDSLTGSFNLIDNRKDLTLAFPNMLKSRDITVDGVGDFSAPKLESVGGAIRLRNNTFTELEFPALSSVTGIFEYGGGALQSLDIPSITFLQGGVNIQSNTEDFDCLTLRDMQQRGIIKGSFTCATKTSFFSSSATPKPSSGYSKDNKAGAIVGGVLGGIVVIAGICIYCFFHRRIAGYLSQAGTSGVDASTYASTFGKSEPHSDSIQLVPSNTPNGPGEQRYELESQDQSRIHGYAAELPKPMEGATRRT